MKLNLKRTGTKGLLGITLIGILACLPCCLAPFVVPLMAWLGISAVGAVATGWYLDIAGIFALSVAMFYWMQKRKKIVPSCAINPNKCGCDQTDKAISSKEI
jgi:hypothetical protein